MCVCVCVCVCVFFLNYKCGCLCCKGLIEKESMDSEFARGHVSKFYMW